MAETGGLVWIAIITIIIAIVVATDYALIAIDYGTGVIAKKAAASRDIALIIDALYAYPYDVDLTYTLESDPEQPSGVIVQITGSNVILYSSHFVRTNGAEIFGYDPTLKKYSFVVTGKDEPSTILDEPNVITFTKRDGELTIT